MDVTNQIKWDVIATRENLIIRLPESLASTRHIGRAAFPRSLHDRAVNGRPGPCMTLLAMQAS